MLPYHNASNTCAVQQYLRSIVMMQWYAMATATCAVYRSDTCAKLISFI